MPTDEADRPDHPETAATPEAVRRDITVDAPAEHIWDAIRSDVARDAWLDDDDARSRVLRVDRETAPDHISWTWWHADDPAGATRVSFDLDRLDDGRTQVTVVEQRVAPAAATGTLSARASTATRPTTTAATPGTWHGRLVALELLLLVTLAVGVA